MKEKNDIFLITTTLGISFIMNLVLIMTSNAVENPFETKLQSSNYMLADGHKHTKHIDQENNKQKECNPDKGQNCNPPAW